MQKVEASIPLVSMNQMLYSKKSLHISSALRFTSMLIFFLHSISPEISSFQVKSSSNLGIPRASEEQVSGGPAQLIYRIEEEVPRDTVVGHLAEDILQEIYGMVAQTPGMVGPGRESSLVSLMGLSIANRRERGTHHFQIQNLFKNEIAVRMRVMLHYFVIHQASICGISEVRH
ncbi:unnamed protein product [Protopolystoma xenopodis]|uniref:Uncharacterized protein n=1 Tax=Protopolystoma xenopodis TaxID=117903 RepID=A0A3S5CB64_9PLAT|nr:unnamed protein product [Protopolystoma xenopodis]